MKATAKRSKFVSTYAVGSDDPERPYNRLQIAWLRFLGMVLGRQLV